VQTSDTWLDYVTSIGTLLASLAALAAVALTLYLNIWRARRRQPVLTVALPEEARRGAGYDRGEDSGPTVLAPINVSNANGKRSARGVEVLISAGYWVPNMEPANFYEMVHQEPLTWWISDPPQGMGQATADIPPGVTRKAALLYSGHPFEIHQALHPRDPLGDEKGYLRDRLGVFTVVPLSQETALWLSDQLAYEIRLTVVADDVDAVSYRTRLRWVIGPVGDKAPDSGMLLVHPVWDALKRIDPMHWPGEEPADTQGRVALDAFYDAGA